MDPVSLAAGTAASCVVTELIKVAIQWTQAAVKCKSECKKLHEELVVIAPDVERIERRMVKLRKANRAGDAREDDLQMVEDWLRRLKSAIEGAKLDVHRCNSGRFSIDQHKLSARLTAQFGTITSLGHQRQALFLLLGNLIHPPAQAEVQQQQRSENWFENPGESVPRKMADEGNDALRRENLTRLSVSSSSSSSEHGGWSFDYGAFVTFSYGTDSPRADPLRQGTQAMDVTVFQLDEQQHAKAHVSRRHTVPAGTQPLIAKAFGHDPLPAYNKWKY